MRKLHLLNPLPTTKAALTANMPRLGGQGYAASLLPFTAEELQASLGPKPGEGGDELSDDQLGSVAGGFLPRLGSFEIQRLLDAYYQSEQPPSSQDVSLSHEPLHKA